ncbi:MAG: 50S ribosomal protein L18 [Rhabdochlamydiaceae bacterium]|nr:50S ribosomal protein L18 [Rhabdochlamydiaceae bacterium]
MESRLKKRNGQRARRLLRVRSQVRGTAQKPRMSVFKSNKHLSVQVIDDESAVTLFSMSTLTEEMKSLQMGKKSKEAAKQLGVKVAELAKKNKIETVVFDRGRYKYHGLLAELANSAREAGLQF